MKKKTSEELVEERMKKAKSELKKVALPFMTDGIQTITCAKVGISVGLSGQGVLNYINGGGGNGYLYDAIISEFKKLPKQ